MLLIRGNLATTLSSSTNSERAWLQDLLSIESKRWARGGYETVLVRLFDPVTDTYPAGFDASVQRRAKADGVDVKFLDKRTPPALPDPDADLSDLRDYQRDAFAAIALHRRGVIEAGTGAGKSYMIARLPAFIPCRWLMLVHKGQLADDVANRYEKLSGDTAGRYYEKTRSVPKDARFVAACFPAFTADLKAGGERGKRAKDLLAWAEGIAVDEFHTAAAASHLAIVNQTAGAYWRIGFSGTALDRSDKKIDGVGAVGPIIYRIPAKLLIERGVLAEPTVRMVTCRQAPTQWKYAEAYEELVVDSPRRNALLVKLAERAARPGLLFVNHLAHGKALERDLLAAGIRTEFVWGKHSVDWRKSILRRLVQGHYDILISSPILTEGVDVPELRSIINGAAGKAVIPTMQRLGRGMRIDRDAEGNTREGGTAFELWDVFDQITHGVKFLERHAQLRRASYASAGHKTFIEPEPVGLPPTRAAKQLAKQLGIPGVK